MNLSHILDYCRGCLHLHTCANTHSIKPFLTVNLGVLQLLNMLLAQLIDPGLIFARLFGFKATEHSRRLLGISNNYADRQAEIFRHAKDNSIKLEAYIKQITMSQISSTKSYTSLLPNLDYLRELTLTYILG